MSDDRRIPEITTEELQSAISKLKTGKSPDSNGIRAEDIKACDDETREMVRQLFNEIIKRNNFTPEEWKKVKIKVIHKKGDVENVSNYRPICALPAMYKLFSTILYGRLYPMLDQRQAEDQAGFRKTYQTTDHLATYRLIEQKCHEWGIKMWTATVDFTKAFDSISHNSIWEALKSCNVDHEYVSLRRNIFRDQKASAQTDEESNIFDIQKNLSKEIRCPACCSTVLQYSLKDEIQRWQKENRQAKPATDILRTDMAMVGIQWASPNQAGTPKPAQPVDRFQCSPTWFPACETWWRGGWWFTRNKGTPETKRLWSAYANHTRKKKLDT